MFSSCVSNLTVIVVGLFSSTSISLVPEYVVTSLVKFSSSALIVMAFDYASFNDTYLNKSSLQSLYLNSQPLKSITKTSDLQALNFAKISD